MKELKWFLLIFAAFILFGCEFGDSVQKQNTYTKQEQSIQSKEGRIEQKVTETYEKKDVSRPSIVFTQTRTDYKGPKYSERAAFFHELYNKFGKNIQYDSELGKRMVNGFRFRCPHTDGRVLPFLRILLLEMYQTDFFFGNNMHFNVVERGGNVGVLVNVKSRGGEQVIPTKLAYEFKPDGRLRIVFGIHRESIYDACLGKHGALWSYPEEDPFFR